MSRLWPLMSGHLLTPSEVEHTTDSFSAPMVSPSSCLTAVNPPSLFRASAPLTGVTYLLPIVAVLLPCDTYTLPCWGVSSGIHCCLPLLSVSFYYLVLIYYLIYDLWLFTSLFSFTNFYSWISIFFIDVSNNTSNHVSGKQVHIYLIRATSTRCTAL